jgi:hypothetical protein
VNLGLHQVILQALTKIAHADEGIDDGKDDEDDGHDRKCRERLPDRHVILLRMGLVDAHQLEKEVCESAKVEEDDCNHAGSILALSEEGSKQQDCNRDGDGGGRKAELILSLSRDDDEELHGEAKEEEEIKLQQGDVDLTF